MGVYWSVCVSETVILFGVYVCSVVCLKVYNVNLKDSEKAKLLLLMHKVPVPDFSINM